MRIISYYLPQFHEVKENNEWWGAGFTEWTNVKKAKPLFNNHYQPQLPMDNNFYDLSKKESVIWQTDLAQKYGVYGFAYYHYWFMGRKILEMPAENLLKWKDIKQNFFFFWANHNWIKSINGKREILLHQTYGDILDWGIHFEYFLPFFKDERYIKVDNKPVIGIYNLNDIKESKRMVLFWNKLAKKEGYEGVYIIESTNQTDGSKLNENSGSDAVVLRQPDAGINKIIKWYGRVNARPWLHPFIKKYYPLRLPYSKVIDLIIESSKNFKLINKKVYYGTYTGWDNTSRHRNRGIVHTNSTPEKFKASLVAIKDLCAQDDFVFINAWNEWAEGMHLEPDQKYGKLYLDAISDCLR